MMHIEDLGFTYFFQLAASAAMARDATHAHDKRFTPCRAILLATAAFSIYSAMMHQFT